jgi:hypothetical protein
MIKVPLPFNMAPVVYFDPITYTEVRDHPILNIGTSYANIRPEVDAWLVKTFGEDWIFKFDGNDYCLYFPNEHDATLFTLRWIK